MKEKTDIFIVNGILCSCLICSQALAALKLIRKPTALVSLGSVTKEK